jgi:O-antigen/teichoic acid export membrane protein
MSAITGVPAAGLRARVDSHLRIPMFRDGYALVLSGMITAVVGAAYWVVAAHRYSAEDIGLNSAAISAMTLIAGIAQLNLASALIRFVPVAGKTTFRLILFSYLTSVAVAGVLAAAFILGGRRLMPSLDLVDETTALAFLFVGSTVTWCVFVLQDAVLTGLRKAVWVPVENAAFSLIKLVLLVAFASVFPRHGIFSSWVIGAIATLVPVTVLIFARLVPRQLASVTTDEASPSLGELTRFIAPDYLGALGWLAAVTVVPLIVTERAGPTENAYFALAWVIVIPLFFVSASMGSSLVVSGVLSDPRLLPSHLRKMLVRTAVLVLPAVAVVEVSAPYLLRIFGDAYSEHGTTLLRLLALSTVPHIPIALAINAARVRRRMRTVVAIQAAECAGILALTWVLLGQYGIDGAGWAWLLGQTAVAAAVALWAIPGLRLSDRVVPVLGRWRGAVDGRRKWRTLRPVLAEILERVTPANLQPGRLLAPTATDAIVVAAGLPREPPLVAIKVAHTEAGSRSLCREIDVLGTLAGDPRLAEWGGLLPAVVAAGMSRGHAYLVQRFVPGVDARRLVGDPELQVRAAAAIGELHRLTATQRLVDDGLLERWIDRPLRTLNCLAGVERVRSRLHDSFAGRTLSVSWIHGDFVPGNVLADGSGVTGIVDWDRAMPDDLPQLDLVQFMLATRLLVGGGDLGSVVGPLLDGARLADAEQVLLDEAQEALPGDRIDLRAAVLLCWLRHVSANLEKSTRYAESRAWRKANVVAVLAEVAR